MDPTGILGSQKGDETMSLELLGAIVVKALRCSKCSEPFTSFSNYHADNVMIHGTGGSITTMLRGEQVTLSCAKCGRCETTNNWRSFIVDPNGS
jgi:hypothetical protein